MKEALTEKEDMHPAIHALHEILKLSDRIDWRFSGKPNTLTPEEVLNFIREEAQAGIAASRKISKKKHLSHDQSIHECFPGHYLLQWFVLMKNGEWRKGSRETDRAGAERFAKRWGCEMPKGDCNV